jgi:hypothetical protein
MRSKAMCRNCEPTSSCSIDCSLWSKKVLVSIAVLSSATDSPASFFSTCSINAFNSRDMVV